MGESLNIVPATVDDFRRTAEKRLPRLLFDYVDGGAGAEVTMRQNVADFEALRLNQRVMVDVSKVETGVELFGEKLAMPLVLAPVGLAGMMARRAEVQAKRSADAAGIPFCLSTVGICTMGEVARVSSKPFWFQLYMLKDRGVVTEMLARAWAQGVRTLVFTVDLAVVGTRYRDIRNGFAGGASLWGRLRSGLIDYALHPRWLWDVALNGRPHVFGNIAQYVPKATTPADFSAWVDSQFDASVDWRDIEWLRAQWRGNLVLKGILDPADAKSAIATGADGLIVSNHGGRQLDGVASAAYMLPRVADAVGGETTLLVDGGIRCGQDLVKARALGAKAALIGRPWVYALAAAGEAGLTRMLNMFRTDTVTALGLTGVPNVSDVTREALLHEPS
jgi:L-lactate dehydrogenase (cytochrome)